MKKLCILVLFFVSINVIAQEQSYLDLEPINSEANVDRYNPEGLWFFAAGSMGMMDVDDRKSLSNDRNGYQLNFKALGSYYLSSKYLVDFGVGNHFSRLSGDKTKNINTIMFEVSPRYRINQSWQLGPVVQLTPMKDSDFQSEGKSLGLAAFLGGAINYEVPLENSHMWNIRLGGRMITDVNIPNYQSIAFLADIQIGFDSYYLRRR